ncbi:MAG: hypothetical protein HND52_00170 [Ignavibacteriae bacterium]|nr:hypothetical protein [Ignavibacteriota bacterium]NOG96361.1 hypothetical protein [Ignavibacteriota bacterium]
MKNILAVILSLLILISCSKDETDSPVEPGAFSTGIFSANIGGVQWNAGTVRAYKQGIYTRINGTQEISDTQNKYSSMILFIDILHLNGPKLFAIGEDGNGLNYSAYARVEATPRNGDTKEIFYGQYVENLSLLDVTGIDSERIRGEFGFRGFTKTTPVDSMNVVNGTFNITF